MEFRFLKSFVQSALATSILSVSASAVLAAPAIIMGNTICQDPSDAFDHQWINTQVDEPANLYFLSGNNAVNGVLNLVGHEAAFNDSQVVYVAIHGWIRTVGDFSADDFATVFRANHAATPTNVTFNVCQSGTPADDQPSTMATVARRYPGEAANSTLIQQVIAPGPDTCPALAVNAAAQPFDPIAAIGDAVYRTDIETTDEHDAAEQRITDAWNNAATTPYPETDQSYQGFCQAQLVEDPAGAWVPGFINQVIDQFGADYLALINTNYAGDQFAVCGTAVQCN